MESMSLEDWRALVDRTNNNARTRNTRVGSKPRKGKAAPSEHDLQVSCVRWFRYVYSNESDLLFAIPNGGWRNQVVASKLKAEGVQAGIPDLQLAIPNGKYHGLFIEMKNGKAGELSQIQREMIVKLTHHGYACAVCHSFEEFVLTANEYMSGAEGFHLLQTAAENIPSIRKMINSIL